MSDPTARRGDNVSSLLEAMKNSKRGWLQQEVKDFLFAKYRYGVTEQTLQKIFDQLKDHSIIVGQKQKTPKDQLHKPRPPTILWFVAK